MGRTIRIFDTTLRDGEQSGCSMNLNEKIEVAKQLEMLKVNIIEAGFAATSPGDAAAIAAIVEYRSRLNDLFAGTLQRKGHRCGVEFHPPRRERPHPYVFGHLSGAYAV